jgi:hypothetical protein
MDEFVELIYYFYIFICKPPCHRLFHFHAGALSDVVSVVTGQDD